MKLIMVLIQKNKWIIYNYQKRIENESESEIEEYILRSKHNEVKVQIFNNMKNPKQEKEVEVKIFNKMKNPKQEKIIKIN